MVAMIIVVGIVLGVVTEQMLSGTPETITTFKTDTTVSTTTNTVTYPITSTATITTTETVTTTETMTYISGANLPIIGPITYPLDYAALSSYALSIINKDRSDFGLTSVVASPINAAQQHADSMLMFHYFSHWDTQGYKAYIRYTILNGSGFVEENIAVMYASRPSFTSTASVEQAMNTLEYQMMYNDSLCCNNGHRINILDPFHNRVSIGVAYDTTHVYFVENFENYYAQLQSPVIGSGNTVQLAGPTIDTVNPYAVLVFYDKPPQQLNATTLNTLYQGSYDQGNFTGGVFPPCNPGAGCLVFPGYVTVYASLWQVTQTSINIQFSISKFFQQYGAGIYTIYMVQGNHSSPQYLTSISISLA